MQSNKSPLNIEAVERVIQEARTVMAQAQRLREQTGLSAEDVRAALESQLSEKDLAEVRASVQNDLAEISRDALQRTQAISSSSIARRVSKNRQII